MQKAYITALSELIDTDHNVLSLLSDSGTMFDEYLAHNYPNQCLNFGIAEENKIGAASGLAIMGKIPYVYTSGAFIAYRGYEFIRDDVCFQNRNVKFVGMGSGLSWSMLGPSHHTTEDLSVLRPLPNITILSPASPIEVKKAVFASYEIIGPVYIRIGMSNEKEIYDKNYEFNVGKNVIIKEGKNIALFVTGSIISEVIDVAEKLEEKEISASIININTIKPFDTKSIIDTAKKFNAIYSIEEHSTCGGIGSAIAEVIADNNLNIPFKRIGLENKFAIGYGTESEVRTQNGLDSNGIYIKIMNHYKNI